MFFKYDVKDSWKTLLLVNSCWPVVGLLLASCWSNRLSSENNLRYDGNTMASMVGWLVSTVRTVVAGAFPNSFGPWSAAGGISMGKLLDSCHWAVGRLCLQWWVKFSLGFLGKVDRKLITQNCTGKLLSDDALNDNIYIYI